MYEFQIHRSIEKYKDNFVTKRFYLYCFDKCCNKALHTRASTYLGCVIPLKFTIILLFPYLFVRKFCIFKRQPNLSHNQSEKRNHRGYLFVELFVHYLQ